MLSSTVNLLALGGDDLAGYPPRASMLEEDISSEKGAWRREAVLGGDQVSPSAMGGPPR